MTVPQPPYQQPQPGPNPQAPGPQGYYPQPPQPPQPGAYPPAPAVKANLGPLANPFVLALAAVGVFGTLIGFLIHSVATIWNQFLASLVGLIYNLGMMCLVATVVVLALQWKKKS